MKFRRLSLILVLALALAVNAAALEVPTDTVVQNLNGTQQMIKTYTVGPGTNPEDLIEDSFVLEGYRYTFADIVKNENAVTETVSHTEIVTVETGKKDLSVVLEQLAPTMEYDDGAFKGTLALDHTTIKTEVSGYASGSKTLTATKTIGPLDRNDMSYIPATTVKDGKTLSLSNVEWQVMGTDLVGEALVPSAYQAVATYSGKASYSYATGYISTAEYVGNVTRNEVESITYQVTYVGEEDMPVEVEVERETVFSAVLSKWPLILGGIAFLAIVGLTVALYRSRHELADLRADILTEEDEKEDEEK